MAKFVSNLDLNQNQVLNGRFESLAADPSSGNFDGRLIYNTTEGTIKVYHGASSAFRKLLRAITSNTTALTVSESNGSVSLSIAEATTSVSGLLPATDKSKLDNATSSNTNSTLVARDATGNFSAGTITATFSGSLTGNVTGDITGQSGTTASLLNHDTDDLVEGATNKYFTDARAISALGTATGSISVNSQKITNLAEPTSASDAATKGYVDAARSGLDVKQSVRAATTANITLSGEQTVDGVALSAGDRVLVKNQNTGSENGIYVVAAGSWSRSTDADSNGEVTPGLFTFVEEGTVNADSGWVLSTDAPITLDTTALVFAQFSGAGQITAGDGLAKSGNTLSVNVDSTSIEIAADTLRIASGAAGDGLGYATGVLSVNVASGGGLEITSDNVGIKLNSGVSGLALSSSGLALKSDIAGSGLTFTSGVLSVNVIDVGTGQITGTLAIANGGTGSTSASGARSSLVGDITVGTGVSTPTLARVASKTVGNGTSTSFTVAHNFGTQDVIVTVYDVTSGTVVFADVTNTDNNTVSVGFSSAPASNAYRVVVTG